MSQVIKLGLPLQYLEELVAPFTQHNKVFFTHNEYKLITINDTCSEFLQRIVAYYYKSKQWYCTRDMTYLRFLTILRQLCRYFNIATWSKVVYVNGVYEPAILMCML